MIFKSVASESDLHLRRSQFAIEDQHVGAELKRTNQQLVELAAAQHRSRIDCLPSLNHLVLHHHSGGTGQFMQAPPSILPHPQSVRS